MQIDAEEKVRKYADTVYRIAISILKNKEEAEDAFQEVFMKFCYKAPDFETEEYEKAWIIRVTVNTCKDILKSAWLRRRQDLEEDIPYLTPEEDSTYYEIMKLPEKYRISIYLFYYEGYKIAEISKLLGTKESTVKSQLMRGREILKENLEEVE